MNLKKVSSTLIVIAICAVLICLVKNDVGLANDGVVQIESFIKSIVKTLVGIAGAVAVVFVVIGGFHYITSSGRPDKLNKAKNTLLYSGVGLIIVFAAYAIVDLFSNIAKSSFGG